jgi:hypothetical protein
MPEFTRMPFGRASIAYTTMTGSSLNNGVNDALLIGKIQKGGPPL